MMDAVAIEAPAPKPSSAWFAEASAGVAFATYGAVSGGSIDEHLASPGSALAVGVGYGFGFSWGRIDLGLRLQNLNIGVSGRYAPHDSDPTYRAVYDYFFPTLSATIASGFHSRLNLFGGLSLGTATFVSVRQGESTGIRQIPVFGTFEGGLEVHIFDGLDARAFVAWLPPVQALNVVSPSLGARARF